MNRPDDKYFCYNVPEKALYDHNIKEACFLINRSGWVWTTESCAGHKKGDDPYVRLLCRKEHVSDLLVFITQSTQVYDCPNRNTIPTVVDTLECWNDDKYCEILVYMKGNEVLSDKQFYIMKLAGLIVAHVPEDML